MQPRGDGTSSRILQQKGDDGAPEPTKAGRSRLTRRGLYLEYATLGWNVVGVAVVAVAAWRARSVALAGFGLDSLIEIFASVVVLWQLTGYGAPVPVAERLAARERLAVRLIGAAFLALAIYVAAQVLYTLATRQHAAPSPGGIGWLAATVAAMLALAAGKRHTGEALGNQVLTSEARVTLVDAYLAASILGGLVLNAALGWWWADPLSASLIVYYGVREWRHAWVEATASPIEP